ncbi:nucleotidyltransferase [uncultured Clostridium sp.]|uniref:nucleotidyltransferase n=1 Tax=uncultured Clostridium sp. TaxID=59620 RepID=UPI00262264C3|nr:nucleotidyltransferase [uncultured Clostridium sp.]
MKITGIVTEYNPFHLGHKFHLENAIKQTDATHIICVMSGNFMQRGIPSMLDKWNRAKMAVLNGVDLVIELPLIYSTSSAESFSYGAINILNNTNVVDSLFFGSECGDIQSLKSIASVLSNEPSRYKDLLKLELDKGLPFHSARVNSLTSYLKDDNLKTILKNSNNILGIEYIKAIERLDSPMKPITIRREGSFYNDKTLSTSFSSATSIREEFFLNSLKNLNSSLPQPSFDLLNSLKNSNYDFVTEEKLFQFLKFKLLTENINFSNIPDLKEGIENKILKEISSSMSLDELITRVKSKRYTYTRISRILLSIYLSLYEKNIEDIHNSASYIRPLAFNKKGTEILKKIKEHSQIEIFTKVPKKISNPSLEFDVLGTKAYSLLNTSISPFDDYIKTPFVLIN